MDIQYSGINTGITYLLPVQKEIPEEHTGYRVRVSLHCVQESVIQGIHDTCGDDKVGVI
jgi:hypothetical protein